MLWLSLEGRVRPPSGEKTGSAEWESMGMQRAGFHCMRLERRIPERPGKINEAREKAGGQIMQPFVGRLALSQVQGRPLEF